MKSTFTMQLVFCTDMAKTSHWNYSEQTFFSVPADGSSHNAASCCIQVGGWLVLDLDMPVS